MVILNRQSLCPQHSCVSIAGVVLKTLPTLLLVIVPIPILSLGFASIIDHEGDLYSKPLIYSFESGVCIVHIRTLGEHNVKQLSHVTKCHVSF